MTLEARARQSIDALLVAAAWIVQNLMQGRIVAEGNHHLTTFREVEADLNAKLQRAQPLPLATLLRSVSVSAR